MHNDYYKLVKALAKLKKDKIELDYVDYYGDSFYKNSYNNKTIDELVEKAKKLIKENK